MSGHLSFDERTLLKWAVLEFQVQQLVLNVFFFKSYIYIYIYCILASPYETLLGLNVIHLGQLFAPRAFCSDALYCLLLILSHWSALSKSTFIIKVQLHVEVFL